MGNLSKEQNNKVTSMRLYCDGGPCKKVTKHVLTPGSGVVRWYVCQVCKINVYKK